MKNVILKPHITEKAGVLSEQNVYTFQVTKTATKTDVKSAIKELYKVTPTKIAIATRPSKKIVSRGRVGTKSGLKKAYVYLKKGDKIEFV